MVVWALPGLGYGSIHGLGYGLFCDVLLGGEHLGN